jgi:hypothetical protein
MAHKSHYLISVSHKIVMWNLEEEEEEEKFSAENK